MRLLIDGATVWDGTGAAAFPGKVLIENERIAAVAPQAETLACDGAERLEAAGKFLMPGLVEGHSHLSFVDVARGTALGELAPEEHTLLAMNAARQLLGAGFTSACSAAAAKIRIDVAIRDAIEDGLIDGPRLLAAGPELTVTGGLGDGRKLHLPLQSFGMPVDGAEEMLRAVRLCLREGVDIIYHCDFADEEALDLLESVRDRVFTGPAIGLVIARLEALRGDNSRSGRLAYDRFERLYDASCRTHREMKKRGIRIVVGGDYGFAANPQGTNARDLEHFVKHFGFSASEALQAATRTGGEIMRLGHELGQIKAGYLADLLLVDGDPLSDVRVLQDRARLDFVMKAGVRYRPCQGVPHVRRLH